MAVIQKSSVPTKSVVDPIETDNDLLGGADQFQTLVTNEATEQILIKKSAIDAS